MFFYGKMVHLEEKVALKVDQGMNTRGLAPSSLLFLLKMENLDKEFGRDQISGGLLYSRGFLYMGIFSLRLAICF